MFNNFHTSPGKILIIFGIIFIVIGCILLLASRFKLFGNLPGDIKIKKDNFTLYFPLATCILLSIILTIILNVMLRR